jgi:peptidoglycan hydrolase-like protein with peptidoglycan-binding domain
VPRRRGGVTALLWSSAIGLAATAGVLAGRATLAPASPPVPEATAVSYTVADGSVGRSIRFPAAAVWPVTDLPAGAAEGVLTSIEVSQGQPVSSGTILYTVDLRPVTIVAGDVPAFRDLALGLRGPDVAQLRAHLHAEGHLRTARPSTAFDQATHAAVRRWQRAIGVDPDGVVRLGDVIFAPGLPVRVSLTEVRLGDRAGPEAPVIGAREQVPTFTVTLGADQTAAVPTEGPVTITGAGHAWAGVIASAEQVASTLVLTITAADGGPVCGTECDAVMPPAVGDSVVMQADFTIVPDTAGPVVPVAAIGTTATGDHVVTRTDGREVPVVVMASSDGMAVVDGVRAGDELWLIADGSSAPAGEPTEGGA